MIYKELIILFVTTIILTMIQIWLSGKKYRWQGFLIPVCYLVFAIPYVSTHFLTTRVFLIPDYYQTATFLFPGVWFVMIYFIFYYYRQYRKEGK